MNQNFYETKTEEIEFVPFDIETTGFQSAQGHEITTFILHHKDTYHIWINTDGNKSDAGEIEEEVIEGSGFENILIYVCENETSLLENIGDYCDSHLGDNTLLTAYNGETYTGDSDFDVPFMRTRCFRNGVDWIFDGFWYADVYEVFSKKSRFDTTIKAEPSIDNMTVADIKQFIDDKGYDIHYDSMTKRQIINRINNRDDVTDEMLRNWTEDKNGIETTTDPSDLNKNPLKNFIDDKDIGISYSSLTKDELVKAVKEENYTVEELREWHECTGRDVGKTEASTLDDIHNVMIEDINDDREWRRELPFEIELFEPFDPFVESGEAVTQYKNGNYSGVILHCLADVARTVNLNRMMVEYAPKQSYNPKIL